MWKILFLISLTSSSVFSAEIGCRDENNQLVDWYYLYKLPKSSRSGYKGVEYVYLTSQMSDNSAWQIPKHTIDNSKSFAGQTVSQLYKNEKVAAVMYNDEPPTGPIDGGKGHTKGVMASDAKTGFWLVHSVPHFPPNLTEGVYGYPKTATSYGQSFLCVTMSTPELNKAAGQLLYNEPHIYSSATPAALTEKIPNMVKAIGNQTVKKAPFYSSITIKSMQGTSFLSFAKTRRFKKDLYEDWLAPTLNSDLEVETWQHGTGNLPSNCTLPKKVINVKQVNIQEANYTFVTLQDHSKWAIGTDKNKWVCVGDINRQEHQKYRGGGTVCQLQDSIWQAYKKVVAETQPCA